MAEIGGTTVVVLEQDASAGAVSTVVLRASTDQLLDDLERAVDDGVNTYKVGHFLRAISGRDRELRVVFSGSRLSCSNCSAPAAQPASTHSCTVNPGTAGCEKVQDSSML